MLSAVAVVLTIPGRGRWRDDGPLGSAHDPGANGLAPRGAALFRAHPVRDRTKSAAGDRDRPGARARHGRGRDPERAPRRHA